MKELFLVQETDLAKFAASVVNTLSAVSKGGARVLFLEGDLGSGKTTFTKEVAAVPGVDKDDVHSPTFILKKSYDTPHATFQKLIHIDAYRFETGKESDVLRLKDDKDIDKTLIIIEWPSKLDGAIDEDMTIRFEVVDDTSREVSVHYVLPR